MRPPNSILQPIGQSPFHITVIHDDDSEHRPYVYELMQPSLSAVKEAVGDLNFLIQFLTKYKIARGDHRYSPQDIEIYYDHPMKLITDQIDIRTLLKTHILLVRIKQAQTITDVADYAPIHPALSPTIEFDVMISYW